MQLGVFSSPDFVIAFVIVFFAFVVRGSLGFGSGLISVSLLLFILPITMAVPIVYVVDTLGSLALGTYDFKQIKWQELPWLWPATIIGLAAGAWILRVLPAQHVTALLGLFILAYVAYAWMVNPASLPRAHRSWGAPLGVLGGAMGSLYGGGGPAIVAYLQMRHLDKRGFRATFQLIAVTDGLVRGFFYAGLGLLNGPTLSSGLWLIPAMASGLWIGNRIHFRLDVRRFQYAILAVLALTALKLLLPV
ncbi:sulfite exporter TauE/SafE family protein [Alicyclobacillaceae bacterium I2511]|nr:sulfite exporter TauE/SafE family protein [Alicyclobacillaceae bacterium I2511]